MMLQASAPSSLRFDAVSHRYWLGARELVSVTTALKDAGLINTDWFTDDAADRGTYVHQACELVDAGDLGSIESDHAGYIAAYECFLRDAKPEWAYIELPVHDVTLGYAGTLDRAGFLSGKWVVVDIKTGGEAPWHGIQLAAYARLALHESGRKPERFTLHLRKNGIYRLETHADRGDEQTFFAALRIAAFRRSHGLCD